MADKKFVAIDFGTCNSYISHITDSGRPEPVNLNTGGSSELEGIQTAVLYYNAGDLKGEVRFGIDALDEYSGATPQERQEYGMRLARNFKPDIGFSEQARKDAVTFLKCLLDTAKKCHLSFLIPSESNNVQVTIGIPSEASRDGNVRTKGAFSEALIKIAEQAGWGKVRLLDEPFGPLFYKYKDTDIRTAREHILEDTFLVIDFGGGTCDFTVLSDGKILESWGDMCLGGRLFDDLFYQWTLELSDRPEYNEKEHLQNGMDGYFRDYVCRIMKEDFSIYIARYGKDKTWRINNPYMCETGTRLCFTWDEFIKRARKYKSSDSFCQAYKDILHIDPQLTDFKMGQEIDLLQWFEEKLLYGLCNIDIDTKDIDHVLFAGGSSMLPFVSDICVKEFSEDKLERSLDVFEAVASGLVAYTNIKKNAANAMRKLNNSRDEFIEQLSNETLDSLKIDESSSLVTTLGTRIFDELAVPVLREFAQNGGAMKDLEKKMESFVRENHDKINIWLAAAMKDTIIKVNQHMRDKLNEWFNKNDVPSSEFRCQDAELPIFKMDQTDISPISWGTAFLEWGLGALISSVLCGAIIWTLYALGTAAIIQPWLWPTLGPLLIAGGVLTAVVTGSMTIKDAVEKISLPPYVTSWLIDEKQIGKMREEFLKKFSLQFPETYNKLVDEQSDNVKKAIQNVVENELKRYNKILEMEN